MQTISISVILEDILLGIPGDTNCTPCANAIRRTLPIFATVEVIGHSVQCISREGELLLSTLPGNAAHFENMFHRGFQIEPFQFGIRTPE